VDDPSDRSIQGNSTRKLRSTSLLFECTSRHDVDEMSLDKARVEDDEG